ncbi:MAG: SufD family Fe-S cluster assembly protein [Oscillospiraceae bacterium]|nr:SufD family Fe-S cluster assembly protein [Oscillospiraceae bacterium]
MTDIQKQILARVADMKDTAPAHTAVNIRTNGQKAYRSQGEHIKIESKTDRDGIDIRIDPGTKGEKVYIPVVVSASGFQDMVYNDFYVGEGADVEIIAGCGIHNDGCDESRHDGIHTFYLEKNARVTYIERHYGEGSGTGKNVLNPQTVLYLKQGATVTLETSQIGGVDDTKRYTKIVCEGADSEAIIHEKLLTQGDQTAVSEMDVILNGENSKTRVISRSVAKENSVQTFYPRVEGNNACFGHVSCDSIIMGNARVKSIPAIACNHVDAGLMHEAAIGKIAGEQILKLKTLGLTDAEAEEKILEGFLR